MLLAVNEALANAAEFAYLDLDPADDAFGTVDLDGPTIRDVRL